MPFVFKKKVLNAAIISSLLYACETWLGSEIKDVEKVYVSAIKAVLGVRETTRNDTTLIEAGMPSLSQLIKKRTRAFMKKELNSGRTQDTPLIKIYKLCESKRTKGFTFLSKVVNPATQPEMSIVEKFRNQDTSKARTYREINPELTTHKAYTTREYINERERLTFTKFRLSSHHLKIETGRWARIDVEDRVCDCGGGVQDEQHVLFSFPKTESERTQFGVDVGVANVGELMDGMDVHELVSFVHCCMKHFR